MCYSWVYCLERKNMKAKYGIASIVCWALSWCMIPVGILLVIMSFAMFGRRANILLECFIIVSVLLTPLLGVLLACLGRIKKEIPRGYYFIGFLLNLIWFLLATTIMLAPFRMVKDFLDSNFA